jgi:hypothetical protein
MFTLFPQSGEEKRVAAYHTSRTRQQIEVIKQDFWVRKKTKRDFLVF